MVGTKLCVRGLGKRKILMKKGVNSFNGHIKIIFSLEVPLVGLNDPIPLKSRAKDP